MIDQKVLKAFLIDGEIEDIIAYGNGHINDTYLVKVSNYNKFIIQTINKKVFKEPKKLMKNINNVITYMKEKDNNYSGLEIILTTNNKLYYKHHNKYYRCYKFIKEGITYEFIETEQLAYECGKEIGKFNKIMSDYPLQKIYNSIPDFHNSLKRYYQFLNVINKLDINKLQKEVKFVMKRSKYFKDIYKLILNDKIRNVVTHNDTKSNNIMINQDTNKSICVIDLDTVMVGSYIYDFGDGIRSIASTVSEENEDLRYIDIDVKKFTSFTLGYMSEMKNILTEDEKNNLVNGAIIITLECGMRFLMDYYQDNIYFKVKDPIQNLRRARVCFKLVTRLEEKKEQLENIVRNIK